MIFQTPRLTLREATQDDAPFIYELLNSPNWIAQIGDRSIRTLDAAANYVVTRLQPQYVTYGFGLWLVELQAGEVPIGICGLLRRAGLDDPDIGFAFLPGYEGLGYAFEAAQASLAFARRQLGISKVLAITTETNARSIQLLERIGLRHTGEVVLPGETEEMMLFTTP
jgi:RimJ/RimL family protein N-acetyltransferase